MQGVEIKFDIYRKLVLLSKTYKFDKDSNIGLYFVLDLQIDENCQKWPNLCKNSDLGIFIKKSRMILGNVLVRIALVEPRDNCKLHLPEIKDWQIVCSPKLMFNISILLFCGWKWYKRLKFTITKWNLTKIVLMVTFMTSGNQSKISFRFNAIISIISWRLCLKTFFNFFWSTINVFGLRFSSTKKSHNLKVRLENNDTWKLSTLVSF